MSFPNGQNILAEGKKVNKLQPMRLPYAIHTGSIRIPYRQIGAIMKG